MGIFDVFKKKRQPETIDQTAVKEPYLGDLDKTQLIFELIDVPRENRGEEWQKSFLENIIYASFRCGDPQVITGPDGFPYFQLLMPKPNEHFQCYVIDRMKDDFLLQSGYGVVINPDEGQPDWVLSYGDILNLHLTGSFYTTGPTLFSGAKEDETIHKDEKVLVGQPSEVILPKMARTILRQFLINNGVKSPKVLLMSRHGSSDEVASQDLVFNLTPESFESEELFRSVTRHLAWFLPRHYSFAALAEKQFSDCFMPL
ncbi:hypothetical protein SAMN04487898_10340 [Pedobacter sp. ok626]|uniref:hypothetical protein n=1 Tax=Pedobacter sp. ok626 TaxID=1761882 RepID=UPI000887A5E9|nr:hypothetical protein [Pedobacter sp. ok626]SDJ47932.1 hypothetical protein SAMN04487898_10340 [Pedobacter sp. ok626]